MIEPPDIRNDVKLQGKIYGGGNTEMILPLPPCSCTMPPACLPTYATVLLLARCNRSAIATGTWCCNEKRKRRVQGGGLFWHGATGLLPSHTTRIQGTTPPACLPTGATVLLLARCNWSAIATTDHTVLHVEITIPLSNLLLVN